MKTIYNICFISFLIFIVGCKKEAPISLAQDYNLKLGFTVSFNDDELQIHFDEVVDERCPIGLDCEWEGSATVKVIVTEKGVETDYEFTTSAPVHMDTILMTNFGDYRLELESVNPYPDIFAQTPEVYNIDFNLTEVE